MRIAMGLAHRRSQILRGLAGALLAVVAGGCAATEPGVIDAGRLGKVDLALPNPGTMKEGSGEAWTKWVWEAGQNAYSQPEKIPRGHALPRKTVLAGLDRLMHQQNGLLWIGHSTFLIRIGGKTVLTDPVFSDHVSPFPPLGPKRYLPPALHVEDLPALDLVLVSHSHYDHLDVASMSALGKRFPDVRVMMPNGTETFATEGGFRNVRGADPGQERRMGNLAIMALPAYHTASRSGVDAGLTPCLSWSLRSDDGTSLFFTGDTAYGPVFKRIRKLLGPHQVALVPIGAYEVRHEVHHVHANPEEAVKIAREIGAHTAVGMHWGTFPLSPEHPMEPAARFHRAGPGLAQTLRICEVLLLGAGHGKPASKATVAQAN